MKKNKNIILAVLGGIAACFVSIGLVFLFPSNQNHYQQEEDATPVGDVVSHGTGVGCANATIGCSEGTYDQMTNKCWEQIRYDLDREQCEDQDGDYINNRCLMGNNNGQIQTWCTECPENAVLEGHLCYSCPEGAKSYNNTCITCPAGQGNDYGNHCGDCESGTYSPANDYQCHACPEGYTSAEGASTCQCDGIIGPDGTTCVDAIKCYQVHNNACVERQVAADSCDRSIGNYATVAMCDANLAASDLPNGQFVNTATHAVDNCDNNYSSIPNCSGTKASCCVSNAVACSTLGSTSCGARSDCEYDSGNGCHDKNKTCYTFSNNYCHTTYVQFSTDCNTNGYYYTENECKNNISACYGTGTVQGLSSVRWTTAQDATEHNYVKLANVSQATCNQLASGNWCFKDNEDNYHWGLMYSNGSYTHVPDISVQGQCGKKDSNGEMVMSCYCSLAGDCAIQTTANQAFPNLSDDSACALGSLSGHTIIGVSDGYPVHDVITALNGNGKVTDAKDDWVISDTTNITKGDDCKANDSTCHLTYTGSACRVKQNITISAKDSTGATKSLQVSIWHFQDWSGPNNLRFTQEQHDSFVGRTRAAEKFMSDCEAFENWVYDDATGYWTADKYNRCCGPSGGSNPTPTPEPGQKYDFCCAKTDGTNYVWKTGQTKWECQSGYAIDESKDGTTCKNVVVVEQCFKDSDGGYHWTSTPENGWIIVNLKETECNNEKACYEDTNGNRVWDYKQDGYTLITSIKDEDTCKNPKPSDACYVNDNDALDYKWSSTPISGYTKVDLSDKECQPQLCYLNAETGEWKFGKYENTPGFYKLEKEDGTPITSAAECATPKEGCYKDADGNYEWGDYSNDSNYTLVPNINKPALCNNDVPTPSTDSNTARIVYIFMAILMAAGIAFIYYSAIAKKNNN